MALNNFGGFFLTSKFLPLLSNNTKLINKNFTDASFNFVSDIILRLEKDLGVAPGSDVSSNEPAPEINSPPPEQKAALEDKEKKIAQQRNKEQKKLLKQQKPKTVPVAPTPEETFLKANIRVGKILTIEKHPEADSLYHCQVDVNDGNDPRSLVTGLVSSYKLEELDQKKIVAIINLKPQKLRGILSNAMLLAGSDASTGIRILEPPQSAQIGEKIILSNYENSSNIQPPNELNAKQWKKIVSLLKVKDGKAQYSGYDLQTEVNQDIIVKDLPNGSEIH